MQLQGYMTKWKRKKTRETVRTVDTCNSTNGTRIERSIYIYKPNRYTFVRRQFEYEQKQQIAEVQ